ncbi:hypothetical protein L0222_32510, partial [bacterium]|nr:hypothetical protein [bacterium]
MKGEWYFNRPKPGDKNREPILGEFFATEAISNPGEALVREGIQNSLDAGSGGLVRVRVYISGQQGALGAGSAAEYFPGLWPHITAEANGLHEPPTLSEKCAFLTFEDFGTSGLTGNVKQWHDIPGNINPFYYFFRAEGQSGKSQQDRGRWGVGKTVFPRASRISSYFGLTVRADEKNRLLMGQSVLKSHYVEATYFSPDGYFGMLGEDGLTLPIEDPDTLAKFSRDFGLVRGTEPGLSVVVPYCVDEITERSLVAAVCRDYFYPILAAKLKVTVASPNREVLINHETILEVTQSIADELPQDLPILLELAEWATEQRPNAFIKLAESRPDRAIDWTAELFSEEQITTI